MPSRRAIALVAVLAALAAITGAVVSRRSSGPELEVFSPKETSSERAGLCPWREPQADLKRFYGVGASYRTELLVLSRKRLQILKRLGPGHTLESNSLYVYPVSKNSATAGTVCVRRAAGKFGAIEIVVALDGSRKILGVKVQRQRELPATAALLATGHWLDAFAGKTTASEFRIGSDLPAVPEASRQSCEAIADAVRSILIELDEGSPAAEHNH